MPALANPTLWRTGVPYHKDGFLWVVKPRRVFQAQINMASATYPLTSLTFDTVTTGAYTDIKPGMTLMLGSSAGGSDLGRTRVRAAATSSTIPIGRTPKGINWGELHVSDNVYITVLELYEVWSKIPFITASGVSFKDQTAFAANIAQPPIANGGCAVADWVDEDTGVLVVNFDASASTFVDPGASSLTYSWNFGQGDTSTSISPTGIEFEPGFYYVELEVSDGTRSHKTRIPVYAAERTGTYAPVPVEVDTLTLRAEGATHSFTLRAQNLDLGDYPYGTLVIYFEDEYYGNTQSSLAGPAGREKVKFVGWIGTEPTSIQYSSTGAEKFVRLTALSATRRLAKLPGFGQIIQRKSSPTTWQEMKRADIDRYLHHLLHWHSTALEVAPFTWSGLGADYPFTELSSDGQSLYAQVDQRAAAIACRLVCTQRGELKVKPDPQRQPPDERTSVVIVDIEDTDWSDADYEATPEPQVHWLHGNAIIASSSTVKAVFCISPGATPGQGEGEQEFGNQLVKTQAELNGRNGRDYIRLNPSIGPVHLKLTHGGDAGLDAAEMEWVRWGISAETAAQRGLTIISTTRWLLMETTITSDHRAHTADQSIVIEKEIIGLDAETVTPKPVTTETPVYPAIPTDDTYGNWPEDPDVIMPEDFPIDTTSVTGPAQPDASGNMVLLATSSKVALCTNFRRSSILKCNDITPELAEAELVKQAVWSGFGVDVYVLVNDGTNSRVFYTENALASSVVWDASESITGTYTMIEPMSTQGQVKIEGVTTTSNACADIYDIFGGGGTIDEDNRTDNTIPASSTLTVLSDYRVQISVNGSSATPSDEDCRSASFVFTPPDAVVVYGWIPCGGSYPGDHQEGLFIQGETCFWELEIVSSNPFDVVITLGTEGLSPCGDCGDTPTTKVAYSSDFGATFATPKNISPSLSADVGFDVDKIGSTSLVAAVGQVMIATDPDGDYEAYGDPLPDGIAGNCIFLHRHTFAGGNNAGVSTPQYVLLSEALSEDDTSAFRVTSAGTVFTDITPTHSGDFGTIVSPNAFASPWKSASRMAAIFNFDGTKRLKTSANSGGSWSDRGALTSDAIYIRIRKGDDLYKELYIADGDPKFSNDFGATITTKTMPFDGPLVSIEPYG